MASKRTDYTAAMGVTGADGVAQGKRAPVPPSIKNKNKPTKGKKTGMPKRSTKGIPYR